jgi:hypothetical protein
MGQGAWRRLSLPGRKQVKDTPSEVEEIFCRMLMRRSGEERVKMGCSMHATARALVIASIGGKNPDALTRGLFLRFYGHEFETERRKRIVRALRKLAKPHEKHARVRVAFEPAETKRSMRVAERPARYGIKRLAKRRK